MPDIPGNTRSTRKYPKEKNIPGNTRSYFSTLLPDPNPTRYPVFCSIPDPTRPDTEKPYPLGTVWDRIYCGGGVHTALMIVHWVAIFYSVSLSIQIQPKYGPLLFWLIRYPNLCCYGPNLINQLKLIELFNLKLQSVLTV